MINNTSTIWVETNTIDTATDFSPKIPDKNLVKRSRRKRRSLKSRLIKLIGLSPQNPKKSEPQSFKKIPSLFKPTGYSKKNTLPEEYFLQRAADGSFKVIKNKAVTAAGIDEEHLHEKTLPARVHSHSRKKTWFNKLKGVFRKHRTRQSDQGLLRPETNKKTKREFLYASLADQLSVLVKSWLSFRFVVKLIKATLLFIVAYIITWFIYSVAVIFTASFFNISAVLFYYEVMWPAGNAMPPWSASNSIVVTLSGPLVSLFMSLLYFYLLQSNFKLGSHSRTLLFWLFALSLAHFFGAFAAGVITWEGFGYVMEWMHLHTFFLFLFSTLFLIVMGFIGWKYARFMLEIRPLHKHGNNIQLILVNRMLMPYVIGTLLLLVMKYPNAMPQHPNIYDYDGYILASVMFMVIPPLFNKRLRPGTKPYKANSIALQNVKYSLVILFSIGFIAIYRLGLATGLYVYMKFIIDVVRY